MHEQLGDPIVVDLPLRGTWVAGTSPADRIPSHGTEVLAQRFAFDFVRLDRGRRLYAGGQLRAALVGVALRDVYGYGQPVHSPFDGVVVATHDGIPEPQRIFLPAVIGRVLWNTVTYRPEHDFTRLAGNHVIVRRADGGTVHAAVAHLATGSVRTTPGQPVSRGEVVGLVGHSGNSTAPHLHLQLMDGPDPRTARALPCAFAAYEVERDRRWERVERGIPGRADRIRSVVDGTSPEVSRT
jgi:murein DD-endopeptidase MepM/ murein hydrolase activator NlpD